MFYKKLFFYYVFLHFLRSSLNQSGSNHVCSSRNLIIRLINIYLNLRNNTFVFNFPKYEYLYSLEETELNDPSEHLLLFRAPEESLKPASEMLKLLCLDPDGKGTVSDECVEDEDEKSDTFIVDMDEGEVFADIDTGEDSPGTKTDSQGFLSCI